MDKIDHIAQRDSDITKILFNAAWIFEKSNGKCKIK